ncbi:Zn(2)-C6 fungal-type DNA-binding domain [Cordyceps militaris]|uniref:Zn(2)-C6 fungal-type DNA-binding domain n=1 Tax=Cordyceps militaris TaxID=73501 RepID=A0A2H4SBA7_CORMI|nr:Zn(2)-C6 fungal-type DNA-binding domain [Cordyceps militaris]
MFATWKYDRDTSEVQNIRLAYDPISARSSQHQACDRCHEKKLKCSGEKNGCDRCVSSAHACVYNRSEARCSRRGKRGSSRCSTDGGSAIDDSLSRNASNAGSPSRRSTQAGQQNRVRKGSQSRRKSTCSSAAQSRSSTEPDADFTSPRASAAPSVTGSPYCLAASFATISESGDFEAALASPYDAGLVAHQQQQHLPYSMPYHDCGYQSGAIWPDAYPRDPSTSAGMSNSFLSTTSNPHAFTVLTPPDEYMQFQAFASLQTAGADLWPYHR